MGTSIIMRVGTRIYVIRIAAVSQEHVPVCITRKITRVENDMVLVIALKLAWFQCCRRNWLGCCVRGGNRLDFSVGDRN